MRRGNALPKRSETKNSLNKIVYLVDKIRPLYPQAFEMASSKAVRGTVQVSGGEVSDPTGETASCSCEGGYHICPPAQLLRAARAISDAEALLSQALVKVNGIFNQAEFRDKEEVVKDEPGKWVPDFKPVISEEEHAELEALKKEREAGKRGVA